MTQPSQRRSSTAGRRRSALREFGADVWDAYPHPMWVCMIGIVGSAALAGVLGAVFPSMGGAEVLFVLVWMVGFGCWIIVHESKSRWPHLGVFQRYVALVTFDARRQDQVAASGPVPVPDGLPPTAEDFAAKTK